MYRYQLSVLFFLISTVGLFSLDAYSHTYINTDCDNFIVEVESKNTIDGDDGELILSVKRDEGSYTINIFGEGHSRNRLEAKNHEKNLSKGEYIIVVQDNAGCSKMLRALIK